MSAAADRVWNALVAVVMDTRGDWRRRVSEATGLSFGRLRALKRLNEKPLALKELAESMGVDAPAATVAVNALEQRGLVVRTPHPTNGRVEHAPAPFASLSPRELAALERALERFKT